MDSRTGYICSARINERHPNTAHDIPSKKNVDSEIVKQNTNNQNLMSSTVKSNVGM